MKFTSLRRANYEPATNLAIFDGTRRAQDGTGATPHSVLFSQLPVNEKSNDGLPE